VVGGLQACSAICFGSADARSGPSGENPTGTAGYNTGNHGLYLQDVQVTCLAVSGNEAAVGFYGPNGPTYYYPAGNYSGFLLIQDNVASLEATGDGASGFGGGTTPPTQAACEAALPLKPLDVYVFRPEDRPNYAAFTVHDAKPWPTQYAQCRHAGWVGLGLDSRAQCDEVVLYQARQACIFERVAHGITAFRAKYGLGPNQDHAMRHCVRLYTGW
jgi:hypothetical protein